MNFVPERVGDPAEFAEFAENAEDTGIGSNKSGDLRSIFGVQNSEVKIPKFYVKSKIHLWRLAA